MKTYNVETTTATVYKIRRTDRCGGWADITIREWPGGGSIDIQSDFGSYSHFWNSIGERSFRKFLASLDAGYFFGKCMGRGYDVYDPQKTEQWVRELVIERRRDGDLNKEEARDCWDEIQFIDFDSADAYYYSASNRTSLWEMCFGEDHHSLPHATKPHPQAEAFWEIIWPVACETWAAEELDRAA
jgi:hypothetical protein